MGPKEYLKNWITEYIKNRNTIFRNLISIGSDPHFDLAVIYKDKKQYIDIEPEINVLDSILAKLDDKGYYSLLLLNTADNFKIILANWQKLVRYAHLSIFFVNPFSSLDKKWIIFPYTHHKICDESSLESGLKAMFDMVEPITKKDIEEKFK
jgi:hypothetical protein